MAWTLIAQNTRVSDFLSLIKFPQNVISNSENVMFVGC